jgi:hypothetical protein
MELASKLPIPEASSLPGLPVVYFLDQLSQVGRLSKGDPPLSGQLSQVGRLSKPTIPA